MEGGYLSVSRICLDLLYCNDMGNGEEQGRSAVLKLSVVVDKGSDQEISLFSRAKAST